MQQDFANVLGNFFKLLAAVVVGGFALVLEYTFFQSISPPDKPWFPYLAMSLTIGGFLCWMLSFRLVRHNPMHTMIAFLMMIGCAAASLVVAGTEFYSWIAEHYSISTSPLMYQNVTTMLLIIFCGHVVALIVDVSCAHFAKHPFRGNAIPQAYQQTGYAIQEQPSQRSNAQLETELRNNPMYAVWFNWMEARRGATDSPLASSHRHDQPKEEAPANLDSTGQIEVPQIEQPKPRALKPMPRMKTPQQVSQNPQNPEGSILKEGVSMLTQKLSGFIRNGKTAGHAPGNGKTNTSKNTSTKG